MNKDSLRTMKDNIIKSQISGKFEIQLDEKRLEFLVASFISPVPGHECSISSLRNMLTTLKIKYPDTWKDILSRMISQVPDATQSSYISLFEGKNLTQVIHILSLPQDPESAISLLSRNIDHPEFNSKLKFFFQSNNPESLFIKYSEKSAEEFYNFVSIYYLYDSQNLFNKFEQYIDKAFNNKSIETIIQYTTTHEKILKIFPNGKLLHSVYSKLSILLSLAKGAKLLANYCNLYLLKNTIPAQIEILYILCGQKDQFEKYHLDFCIKRLLRNFNPTIELQVCEIIQQKAGPDAMDIIISLLNSAQTHQLSIPKMSVLITTQRNLSFSLNPSQTLADLTPSYIPSPIDSMLSEYLAQFKEKFPHKTLNFFFPSGILELQYGGCSIKCNFIQGCILLLFNQKNCYKKEDIVEKMGDSPVWKNIVLDELESLMEIFEMTEQGVVISLPKDSNIDLTLKEESDLEDSPDNIDEVRKPYIDCFVVKLLKHHKQMDFTTLLQHLNKTLKFIPTEALLQERLKNLESRGFIWQVENTSGYIP